MKITAFLAAAAIMAAFLLHNIPAGTDAPIVPLSASAADFLNPYNKQNDEIVEYDPSYWIQPPEWNVPTVNPRNYQGGLMLFGDKIGLEPETARGTVQRVYFSVHGAKEAVSYIKFHIFYDTRLGIKPNSDGDLISAGKAIRDFDTGSALVEEGQLAFYAVSSEDTELPDASIFTIDFIIPEKAEPGEIYPIGIVYRDDGIVADTFINSAHDEAGRLQMTYLFTKGMYSGYIKMMGEKKHDAGDVNNDGLVNAVDASDVLTYYANISTNTDGGFTEAQKAAADHNGDGQIDASDASSILAYYAESSTADAGQ